MSWFKNFLRKILPEDPDDSCGYGPFKLSSDHPFTPACKLHDWEFEQAHKGEADKPLAKADWDLFYRWVLIAKAQITDEERCALALQICSNWPLARKFGGYLWDGDPKHLAKLTIEQTVAMAEISTRELLAVAVLKQQVPSMDLITMAELSVQKDCQLA